MAWERSLRRLLAPIGRRVVALVLALSTLLFLPLAADRLFDTALISIGIARKCPPATAASAPSPPEERGLGAFATGALEILFDGKACIPDRKEEKSSPASGIGNQWSYFGLGQIVIYNKDAKDEKEKSRLGERGLAGVALMLVILGLFWPAPVTQVTLAVLLLAVTLGAATAAVSAIAAGSPAALFLAPFALFGIEICARLLFRMKCLFSSRITGETRYPGPNWRRGGTQADDLLKPLTSQRRIIDRLLEECLVTRPGGQSAGKRSASGHVVGLYARRGQGKSMIIDWFCRKLQVSGHIGIVVNAWTLESEPDIEFALMQTIAEHWQIAQRGWLHYPAIWLALTRLLSGIKLSIKAAGGDMEVSTVSGRAPRVVWRGTLHRMVAAAVGSRWCWQGHRPRRRVVVVLDDIDRCSPLIAQKFVTLVKRSLDLPDLTLVLSCDENLLLDRVFDPLNALLPDLAAVAEDELARHYAHKPVPSDAAEGYRTALQAAATRELESFSLSDASPKKEEPVAAGEAKPAVVDVKPWSIEISAKSNEADSAPQQFSDIAQSYRNSRRRLLAAAYLSDNQQMQGRLRQRISSKYLSENPVRVPPLSAQDIAELIKKNDKFHSFVDRISASVIPEQRASFQNDVALSWHDPTRGGLEIINTINKHVEASRPWLLAADAVTMREFSGTLNRHVADAADRVDSLKDQLTSEEAQAEMATLLMNLLVYAQLRS